MRTSTFFIFVLAVVSGLRINKNQMTELDVEKGDPCMLVPVYPPHFKVLHARLMMTKRTNTGPIVKTIVVFGDKKEQKQFCDEYSDACQPDTGFHGISLEEIIGEKNMMEIHSTFYNGDRAGCWAKDNNRVFQTVKKFYGAAYADSQCSMFWVSDAESVPYRKHNLKKHLEFNLGYSNVHVSWAGDQKCSNVHADEGTDASCAAFFSSQANQFRHINDSSVSQWTKDHYSQQFWFVDQWWTYEPEGTAKFLDLIEETSGQEAWKFIGHHAISDNSLYHPMMEWLATQPGSKLQTRNIREMLRALNSQAFEECCSCENDKVPQCISTNAILGNQCLKQNGVTLQQRMKLLVDAGIFGLGNYNRFLYVPDDALNMMDEDGTGIHWCYNNCFQEAAFNKMMNLKDADTEGLQSLENEFLSN